MGYIMYAHDILKTKWVWWVMSVWVIFKCVWLYVICDMSECDECVSECHECVCDMGECGESMSEYSSSVCEWYEWVK